MNTRLIAILLACFTSSLAFAQPDPCKSDISGDGIVAGADLSVVLSSWGPCVDCGGDLDGNDLVDGVDLATLLTFWGSTCAPTATAMQPTFAPLQGGTLVTLVGDHLLAPTGVTFGGTPATIVSSTRTSVTALAPERRAGVVPVVVSTQGGSVSAGSFTYYGAPTLTDASPSTVAAVGGSTVVITGTGFYGPSVSFNGVPASPVYVQSPTQLSALVPAGLLGSSVTISVSTAAGAATLKDALTYIPVDVPPWATIIEPTPNPLVIRSEAIRDAILATGRAWRVRDNLSEIEMMLIPPGSFVMGCSASNAIGCDSDEIPVRSVTLTDAFYLGRCEVTQRQWSLAMSGENPSAFQPPLASLNLNRPVELVSWNAIQQFLVATGMRLPTEAEWEYSYRAGTMTAFHGFTGYLDGTNDDALVGSIAWFVVNANGATRSVGTKSSNGFGLRDMSGNVWEWVADWYASSYDGSSSATNPTGPATGDRRVIRGGSLFSNAGSLRASSRGGGVPDGVWSDVGFRVARNP
jgi:sulfatase modifying factor 1